MYNDSRLREFSIILADRWILTRAFQKATELSKRCYWNSKNVEADTGESH